MNKNIFKACLKKEISEQLKTHKFTIYVAFAVSLSVLTIALLLIFSLLTSIPSLSLGPEFALLFAPTIENAISLFMASLSTDFFLVMVIVILVSFRSEIKKNKWNVPISSGISPSYMIASKLIVTTLTIIVATFAAFLIQFILSIIFLDPTATLASSIGFMFKQYGFFVLAAMLMCVINICVFSYSKKLLWIILIDVALIYLVPSVLSMITVASAPLINFTPLVFSSVLTSQATLTTLMWICGGISYAVLMFLLVFFAIRSKNIKKQK